MTVFRSAAPVLPVADEARTVAFSVDVLGFTEVHPGILRRDDVELHVWVADGSAPGAETHLAGSASCRFGVQGVEALHARCRAAGVVHPRAPLRRTAWGTREFSVLDPDGNLVALVEPAGD